MKPVLPPPPPHYYGFDECFSNAESTEQECNAELCGHSEAQLDSSRYEERKAWIEKSQTLTECTYKRLVNRRDRYGIYNRSAEGTKASTQYKLEQNKILEHFRLEAVIGLHVIDPGHSTCKFVVVDIDAHSDDDDPTANMQAAVGIANELAELGIHALIEDSDGRGGFHIWIFLSESIPSEDAHSFAQWAVRNYKTFGLKASPECFPKQKTATFDKPGGWIRLPGKHHSRPHLSKFWDGNAFVGGTAGVDLWLNARFNRPDLIPAEAFEYDPRPKKARRPKPPSGNAVSLDQKVSLARAYAQNAEVAIAGQGGDNQTFRMACDLVRGYDLPREEVEVILRDWNLRCQPPWDEERLQYKLDEAEKFNHQKPRGHLLTGQSGPVLSSWRTKDSAELFLERCFTSDQRLIEYRGDFLVWKTNHYQKLEVSELNKMVLEFLDSAKSRPKSDSHQTVPFPANPKSVDQVVRTLGMLVHVDSTRPNPSWLEPEDADPDPKRLVPCKSYLLDVETRQNVKHSSRYLSLNALSFDPKPGEPTRWLRFLGEIFNGDEESIELLRQWFGYNMASDTSYQKMMLIHGPPQERERHDWSCVGEIARSSQRLRPLGHEPVGSIRFASLDRETDGNLE